MRAAWFFPEFAEKQATRARLASAHTFAQFALVALLAALLSSSGAVACECRDVSLQQAIDQSALVFRGNVIRIDEVEAPLYEDDPHRYRQRLVTFEVARSFKGEPQNLKAQVLTGHGGGDCGVPFQIGQQYLVFARISPASKDYRTNICMRTASVMDTADLQALGERTVPALAIICPMMALLIVSAGVLLLTPKLWRRRKSTR